MLGIYIGIRLDSQFSSIASAAMAVLAKYGADAHMWLPGVGYVNGIDAKNYKDGAFLPTAIDDVVGYVGDAAQGSPYGADLLTNGTFTGDSSTGWTPVDWWVENERLNGTADGVAFLNRTVTAGTQYLLEFDYALVGGTLSIWRGTAENFTPTPLSGSGRASVSLTPSATSTNLRFVLSASVDTAWIDNVSLRVFTPTGIALTNTTTAQKPFLRRGAVNRVPNGEMAGAVVGVLGSGGQTPTGWFWGTLAGVTREVVGIGTLATGEKYIDLRISGTNGTGSIQYPDLYLLGNPGLGTPAAQGQTLTASISFQSMAGSATAGFAQSIRTMGVIGSNGSNYAENGTSANMDSPTLARYSQTRTLTNANTNNAQMFLSLSIAPGGTVDYTFRIAQPQLEFSSTPTAYIPTSGAAGSRGGGSWYWDGDGVDDNFLMSAVPFQHSNEHCVVVAVDTAVHPTAYKRIFSFGGATSICELLLDPITRKVAGRWKDEVGGDYFVSNGTLLPPAGPFTATMRKLGTEFRAYVNTAFAATSPPVGTSNNTTARVLASFSGGGNPQGPMYGIVAIKGAVNNTDLLVLQRFLGSLAGVTL